MREVKLLGDLPVRKTFCNHVRYLQLVGRELVNWAKSPPMTRLPGRAKFLTGPFAPRERAESVKGLSSQTEGAAGLHHPLMSP